MTALKRQVCHPTRRAYALLLTIWGVMQLFFLVLLVLKKLVNLLKEMCAIFTKKRYSFDQYSLLLDFGVYSNKRNTNEPEQELEFPVICDLTLGSRI